MTDVEAFKSFSPTILGDVLPASQAMDKQIRPLFSPLPRLAGPAYPVQCEGGDILSLHTAVYFAPRGSVLVVDASAADVAVLGGNFAALAKERGIAGAVVNGVVRDVAELRALQWPVFCTGVCPVAGERSQVGRFNQTINCGGVTVNPGDIIVADEEGIMVVPDRLCCKILAKAKACAEKEQETLEQWKQKHRTMVEKEFDGDVPK